MALYSDPLDVAQLSGLGLIGFRFLNPFRAHKVFGTLPDLRAKVVRALLDVDDYSASPYVLFALLAPPSLEPEFAMQLSALRLFIRSVQSPAQARAAARQLASPQPFDGPYARLQQLRDSPVYGPVVQAVVQSRPLPANWQHELRDRWRAATYKLVLRDRAQDYAGIGRGVNKSLTVSLIQRWTQEADQLQYMLDMGLATEPEPQHDPRPRLKILRLLLIGGLMDPERDRRHRRKPGGVKCQCGGVPSHDHISWVCPRFRQLRAPAIAALPKPLRRLPVCFKRTTVVPANFAIAPAALHTIQTALVNIWQQHIHEWHSAEELATVVVAPTAQAPAAEAPVEKRGHVLKPTPNGGDFCCKCGRRTQYVKHVRLKITKTACPNASLPPDRWLNTPGRMTAESRLDDLFRHTQVTWNRDIHYLVWNRKSGKDQSDDSTFGLLYCQRCGRTWPWMRRHQAFKNAVCQPPVPLPPPPAWVSTLRHEPPAPSSAAGGNPAQLSQRDVIVNNARRRLRRKSASHSASQPATAHAVDVSHVNARRRIRRRASQHTTLQDAHDTPVPRQQAPQLRELPSGSNDVPPMGIG